MTSSLGLFSPDQQMSLAAVRCPPTFRTGAGFSKLLFQMIDPRLGLARGEKGETPRRFHTVHTSRNPPF